MIQNFGDFHKNVVGDYDSRQKRHTARIAELEIEIAKLKVCRGACSAAQVDAFQRAGVVLGCSTRV